MVEWAAVAAAWEWDKEDDMADNTPTIVDQDESTITVRSGGGKDIKVVKDKVSPEFLESIGASGREPSGFFTLDKPTGRDESKFGKVQEKVNVLNALKIDPLPMDKKKEELAKKAAEQAPKEEFLSQKTEDAAKQKIQKAGESQLIGDDVAVGIDKAQKDFRGTTNNFVKQFTNEVAESKRNIRKVVADQEANQVAEDELRLSQERAAQSRFDEFEKKEQGRQDKMREATEKYNKVSDELINSRIDPDRFMNSKTTGNKIALGIGVLLTGQSRNGVFEMLDRAVDRDISMQKADFARRGREANNAYSRLRQTYGDERTADLATRAWSLDLMKMKVQKFASRAKTNDQKLRAEGMIADLNAKKTDLLSKVAASSVKKEKVTAKQAEISFFGKQMQSAQKEMMGLLQKGFDPTSFTNAALARLPNEVVPHDIKRYKALTSIFIGAKLRKESGAVISQSEIDEEMKRMFPLRGDDKKTVKFKASIRRLVVEEMKKAAGPAWKDAKSPDIFHTWRGN